MFPIKVSSYKERPLISSRPNSIASPNMCRLKEPANFCKSRHISGRRTAEKFALTCNFPTRRILRSSKMFLDSFQAGLRSE